jgi:hypothetical protein
VLVNNENVGAHRTWKIYIKNQNVIVFNTHTIIYSFQILNPLQMYTQILTTFKKITKRKMKSIKLMIAEYILSYI